MSALNPTPRRALELVVERGLRPLQPLKQARALRETLEHAVRVGRRRGVGLRGTCIQCGRPLRAHRRHTSNRQQSCKKA